jgi:hypothetical protein
MDDPLTGDRTTTTVDISTFDIIGNSRETVESLRASSRPYALVASSLLYTHWTLDKMSYDVRYTLHWAWHPTSFHDTLTRKRQRQASSRLNLPTDRRHFDIRHYCEYKVESPRGGPMRFFPFIYP